MVCRQARGTVCKTVANAGQDRYLNTPPDEAGPTWVGGLAEMPANCSLTIRECGFPAAGKNAAGVIHTSTALQRADACMAVDRSTSGEVSVLSRQPGWVRIPHDLPLFFGRRFVVLVPGCHASAWVNDVTEKEKCDEKEDKNHSAT